MLESSEMVVKGKGEVSKFLGNFLGLYSSNDSKINIYSDYWLNIAEHTNVINDDLISQLSRFLSSNYFLW